ncbi:ferrous iron transport protein A [Sporolactobacillus shoreicorticis]|uniref:Ferrous iron transport protein A n=1 Tax=Sporolactobacillus shoreicorticis TaxID=1923877 RepID=A0ABW5RZL3_9BACL|nr:FeoA family protein [Sporolactobacillus shoreicorticis]MCO7126818.1 ferrous iron transport protein A [Sporolactobacillus shoreicorticis]
MKNTNLSLLNETSCHRMGSKTQCTPAIPLSMVHTGERVHVSCVCGKDETRRLLGNLGFVENTEVTIIAEMDGNVIVSIKGTRLAVSKTMARRVMTV